MFQVDQRRREMWIQAISRVGASGRKWEPSAHDRVWGLHFVSGHPWRSDNDVDYMPTVFTDAKKRSNVTERNSAREKWASKRSKTKEPYVEMEEAATVLVELSQSAERSNCDVKAVDHAVQTSDGIWEENVSLHKEVATLRAAVDEVKDQLLEREDSKLSLVCGNDSKIKVYTGLPSFAVFMALFTFLEPKMGKVNVWSVNSGRDITRGESSKG